MIDLEEHYNGDKAEQIVNEYNKKNQLKLPKPEKDYPTASLVLCWCAIDGLPVYDFLSERNINFLDQDFINLYIERKNDESGKVLTIKKKDLKNFLNKQDRPLPEFWFFQENDAGENLKLAPESETKAVKLTGDKKNAALCALLMEMRENNGGWWKTFINQQLANKLFPWVNEPGKKVNRAREEGEKILENIDESTKQSLYKEAEKIFKELSESTDDMPSDDYEYNGPPLDKE